MAKRKGRPTKYKKSYIKKMFEYFNVEPTREIEVTHTNKKGEEWTTYEEKGVVFPTMERFANSIGVNCDTIVTWAKATKKNKNGKDILKYPEFSAMYYRVKEMQKDILIKNGLLGHYQGNFAVFVAKNLTDMRDKTEIDATSKGEKITGFNYIVPKDRIDDSDNPAIS